MNDSPNARSGVSATIEWVGKAIGLAAALFAAPLAYGLTHAAIYSYFVTYVGAGFLAAGLTVIIVIVEIAVIFGLVALAMAFLISWIMTAVVMRGLR